MASEGIDGNKLTKNSVDQAAQRLFMALTEQLKTPLVQISRSAELAQSNNQSKQALANIESSASAAINLIDNYLLNAQAELGQLLSLEPLRVSLVLEEAAHQLQPLAAQYDCVIEVNKVNRKCPPAMSNPQGLKAAITSLASVLIEANQNLTKKQRRVSLFGQKQGEGVLTAVFSQVEGLNNQLFANAKNLYGKARMPLGSLTTNSGAGIFIAQSLIEAMASELQIVRRQHRQGLGAVLPISKQLNLKIY